MAADIGFWQLTPITSVSNDTVLYCDDGVRDGPVTALNLSSYLLNLPIFGIVNNLTVGGSATFNGSVTLNAQTANRVMATDGSKALTSLVYSSSNTANALVQRDASSNIYGSLFQGEQFYSFESQDGYRTAATFTNGSTSSASGVSLLFQTSGGVSTGRLTYDYFGHFRTDTSIFPVDDSVTDLGAPIYRWNTIHAVDMYSETFNGALIGNADTATLAAEATKLETARNIYGNSFDGTADLTQIIASTYGGTGNGFTKFSGPATSEKTFTLPNATCQILTDNALVTVVQGGTGLGATSQGDLLYGDSTNSLGRLPKDTNATRYLANTGTNNNPQWNQVSLTTGVTGTLPIGNGGTNIITYTQGDILYASATNTLSKLPKDTTTGRYLMNIGVNNNPQWSPLDLSGGIIGVLPVASGGTGQSSYTNGQLLIGNTTGNTLTKATLTASTGVTITNGAGSISIAIGQPVAVSDTPTFAGLTINGDALFSRGGIGVTEYITQRAGTNGSGSNSNVSSFLQGIYTPSSGLVSNERRLQFNNNDSVYEIADVPGTDIARYTFGRHMGIRTAYTNGGTHVEQGFSRLFLGSSAAGEFGVSVMCRLPADATINQSDLIFRTCDNSGVQQYRMTILGSSNSNGGFVGIGTDAPTVKFHVVGANTLLNNPGTGVTAQSTVFAGTNGAASSANVALRQFVIVDVGGIQRSCNDTYQYDGSLARYKRRFFNQDIFAVEGNTTIEVPTNTGCLKLLHTGASAGNSVWLGMGHGTDSGDSNDRARIIFTILSGGEASVAISTGLPGAQVNRMALSSNGVDVVPDLRCNTRIGFAGQLTWDANHAVQGPNNVAYQAKCYAWNTYSRSRFKKEINDIDPEWGLNIVLNMRHVNFMWDEGEGDNLEGKTPIRQIGYLADDVYQYLPSTCTTDDEGVAEAVDYAKANVVHGPAIKALYNRILLLEQALEALNVNQN